MIGGKLKLFSRILGPQFYDRVLIISGDSLNSEAGAVYQAASPRYDAVDLHCHSTWSDGALSVPALMARAQASDLRYFSITDHDTLDGQPEAFAESEALDVPYVSGVEWSAVWGSYLIHVVGLNFDRSHPASLEAAEQQASARKKRARRIAHKLTREGFKGVEDWLAEQTSPGSLGRPHFADFLVRSGQIKSSAHAFKRYLGAGKVGDVKAHWPDLDSVVSWITRAGGVAVMAHPHRYRMTWSKRRALLADFAAAGGEAMELGVPGIPPNMRQHLVTLAETEGLAGSSGSDFHHDDQHWLALGRVPPLPQSIEPVWNRF